MPEQLSRSKMDVITNAVSVLFQRLGEEVGVFH
jgi:hypothetical protein